MTREQYAALRQRAVDQARYSAHLGRCVDEAGREHSDEEVAAAAEFLARPVQVAQFDLLLGSND